MPNYLGPSPRPPVADRLSIYLEAAGLHEMAKLAAEGHYGDFTSDLDFPKATLVSELETAGKFELAERVRDGEFDD